MTEQLIRDWLSEYAALSPVEAHTFIASQENSQDLVSSIYAVLEGREHYQNLVDPVCNQLFAFYRSRETDLQKFALQFIPTLIYVYLNSVACGKKKSCWSLETLLVGIYNLEVTDESGQPKVVSFRLPSLAQSSIYHETMHLDPASLTQKELRRLEECNTRLISWGPLPQIESINAQNRLKTMTALLFIFNRHLSRFHKSALEKLCKVSSKLTAQGFSRVSSHPHGNSSASSPQRPPPRIPVSSQFLLELLHAIYFAMFNDFNTIAVQALEDVHYRGCYECLADVMLVAGAIRNSIKDTPSGQAFDGPMGLSMGVSPATNTVTVSKSMITNASFRTKKLPDDIPIQQPADGSTAEVKDPKNLMSISEEKEDDATAGSSGPERLTPRGSSLRAASGMSLPKLPNLQALVGKRGRKEGSQERKVTPPQQNRSSSKLTITNGESFELDSMRKKGNSGENGTLSMDDGADSIDSVDKASTGSIDNIHNNGGPPSDSGSFMTVGSSDTIDGDNGTTNSSATPLLGRKSNVEIENRGSLQVSTV